MYIIESKKKNIRAISDTNNSIEFHNKLFDTDDCIITWEKDPTKEEIELLRKKFQEECLASSQKEIAIQNKIRENAIEALKKDGLL